MSSPTSTQPNLTSSSTGTFYFAYGSNLSTTQMSGRCSHSPTTSLPVAIARLDSHAWIICTRGYANVVRLPSPSAPPSSPASSTDPTTVVYGLLYNMSPDDEASLDLYEGHDDIRNPEPEENPDAATRGERPYLQGAWDYNKHYLPVTVTKWLRDPAEYGLSVPGWDADADGGPPQQEPAKVRVMVYVDELRTEKGEINTQYIGRMNRAIRESVALGLPQDWVDAVLRRDVEENIEVDEWGYVGSADGYVEAEATGGEGREAESAAEEWTQTNGRGDDAQDSGAGRAVRCGRLT